MKVVIINAVYKIMSTGRSCYELHDYLCSLGHECKIIYGQNKGDYEDAIYLGNYFDHKLHALLSRLTGRVGCYSSNSTKKLLRFLDKYKPDVVNLGNLHSNFINIEMLLKYLGEKNIRTTLTLHDCFFYTGGCVHYTLNNCFKWQKKCNECKFYQKQGSWFFDKTNYLFYMKENCFKNIKKLGVIGVSDWISEEAKKAPIFKNAKEITRIYNWIDLKKFYPRDTKKLRKQLNLKNKKILLCVASGWNKGKGLDTVINLSYKLSNDEKLIVIGNIKNNIKLNENTIHIPATNSVDTLAEYYSLADVFVQPSLEETFGKVSAEALACGTPIICFNSTANPELVGEKCGSVVKIGDIDELYQGIKDILKNGKDFYYEKCIKFARKNFDKEANIEQYLSLFQRLNKKI